MIDGRRRRVVNGLRLGGLGEVMADLRPGGGIKLRDFLHLFWLGDATVSLPCTPRPTNTLLRHSFRVLSHSVRAALKLGWVGQSLSLRLSRCTKYWYASLVYLIPTNIYISQPYQSAVSPP